MADLDSGTIAVLADLESGTIAVLAEKPSVARDIARELGATSRGDGYLHGNRYVVTWAVGHLVSLAQPHEINPEWRTLAARPTPHAAEAMAACRLRKNKEPI